MTFRFLGRRLRIRHSFTVEDQEIFTTEDIRANERLTSRLDLLEAGNDPDKDVVLASLSGIRRDGCVPLVVAHPHNSGRQLCADFYLTQTPERAFYELVKQWLEPKKTDAAK